MSVRPSRIYRIIREPKFLACPNLEGKLPTDATRTPVSRSNGQRSGLEAGGGIPCRPNPAATQCLLLLLLINRFIVWVGRCVNACTSRHESAQVCIWRRSAVPGTYRRLVPGTWLSAGSLSGLQRRRWRNSGKAQVHSASAAGQSMAPDFVFLSASLYFSKRGAYWDRLCRDVVGRWSLVVTHVHCGQTVHPRPIVTMKH